MEPHLDELFAAIDHAPESGGAGGSYAVREIPGYPRHYFGKDALGAPCLLLGAVGSRDTAPPPIRLTGIAVQFALPCQIMLEGGAVREETLTVVVCTAQSEEERRYFSHVCGTIVRIVGRDPPMHAIVAAVHRLVELFQRLARPPLRSLTGLFGELCVIQRSRSPAVAVQAWRSAVDDRFDFAIDDVRLEVKATRERVREHTLSFEQCAPPAGTVGILASLFLESSGGGLSLGDLIGEIERRLAGDSLLILKLQNTVAETLGSSLPTALHARFDDRLASASLEFYPLEHVPAIRGALPQGVSDVRFRSDLSGLAPEPPTAFIARSERAAALLPE